MVSDWIHAHRLRQPRRGSNSIFDVSMIRNDGHETFRYDSHFQPRLYSTGQAQHLVSSERVPDASSGVVTCGINPSTVCPTHPRCLFFQDPISRFSIAPVYSP
jgi:hypothetical protein